VITDLIISFTVSVVNAVQAILPSWSISLPSISSTGTAIGGYAALWNGYFPVATLATCLAAVLGVKVFLSAWRVVLFTYHQFWGSM
jgi:hypothetical protein